MSGSFAHETAIIEDGAKIGAGTRIWHHAHVRSGAVIGRDCSLGKNVFVDGGAVIGDRVRIVETKPLSKLKRWTLAEVLSH